MGIGQQVTDGDMKRSMNGMFFDIWDKTNERGKEIMEGWIMGYRGKVFEI